MNWDLITVHFYCFIFKNSNNLMDSNILSKYKLISEELRVAIEKCREAEI